MSEIGVIHTEHIKKYYIMGDVEVRALNDITLDVYQGELAAIMGPSGSGKSTLMNILGCLDRPTGGIYRLGGELVSEMNDSQLADVRNRKIGFVFQSFNLLPRSTALENVMLPTLYSKNKANARQRAIDVLEMVGLGARVNHRPKEMSGGQQQRVAIARALINDPEIIMADEPTGNLDSKSGKEIMELLIRLNKEQGKTIILVTHDPKIGRQVPRVISVFDGMLGSEEEQQELKRWTDVNYSRLEGLSGDKAELADEPADPEPKAEEKPAVTSLQETKAPEKTAETGNALADAAEKAAIPETEKETAPAPDPAPESVQADATENAGTASEKEGGYPMVFYRPNPRKMRRRAAESSETGHPVPADEPVKAPEAEKPSEKSAVSEPEDSKADEIPAKQAVPAEPVKAQASGPAPEKTENFQQEDNAPETPETGPGEDGVIEVKIPPVVQGWLKKLKPKKKE